MATETSGRSFDVTAPQFVVRKLLTQSLITETVVLTHPRSLSAELITLSTLFIPSTDEQINSGLFESRWLRIK